MSNKYINPLFIKYFFEGLNKEGIDYVLIKNVGDELPNNLVIGKDIDILVHLESMHSFHSYISKHGRKMLHPYGKEAGWINIYRLPEFEFWRLNTADDLFIDVSNKLSCHSLMPKIWIPLDNHIQTDLWKNKVFDNENGWWRIDDDILYVYLVSRCILDKRQFPDVYRKEINKQISKINKDKVTLYFEYVFFKFTCTLMKMLEEKDFDNIISAYIRCKDY